MRAFAAASVAFVHIAHDDISNGGDPAGIFRAITRFFPWDAGVDIFFVISGFVIVHASARLFGAPGGPAIFIRRRLTRIVPLYWIMTTAFIAVLLFSRDAIRGDIGGPFYIVASYLFIPWPRPDGVMQPALGLGWTLNYEMFFYVLFAPFLVLSRHRAVVGAGLVLGALVAVGPVIGAYNHQVAFWSDPVILEFLFGMEIALIVSMGIKLPLPARVALVVIALVMFHMNAEGVGIRPVIYGLPAFCLVAAAALTPAAAGNAARSLLIRLGDASYAMYLVHPFVMRGFSVLWRKFHVGNEWGGTIYVLAGMAIAQGLALAINSSLERKLTVWLRRRRVVNEVV